MPHFFQGTGTLYSSKRAYIASGSRPIHFTVIATKSIVRDILEFYVSNETLSEMDTFGVGT